MNRLIGWLFVYFAAFLPGYLAASVFMLLPFVNLLAPIAQFGVTAFFFRWFYDGPWWSAALATWAVTFAITWTGLNLILAAITLAASLTGAKLYDRFKHEPAVRFVGEMLSRLIGAGSS